MRSKIFILFLGVIFASVAQRRVTPVDPTAKREIVPVQTDSVVAEPEEPEIKGYLYPLFNGLSVNVNILDGIANLFGQSYGNYEIAAELDLHNRFFPVWEIGIGHADNTPEGLNFTYRNKASLYNRVGMNYNFGYNKTAMSFFYIGIRYGFSFFTYDIDNILVESPYWGESEKLQITGQKSWAHWGELLGGLRVQVYKNFYMGWTVRYRLMFSHKKNTYSQPWYIPGFGTDSSPFGFTYTVGYRFSFGKKEKKIESQTVAECRYGYVGINREDIARCCRSIFCQYGSMA